MSGVGLTGITGGVFMNRYTQDNTNAQTNETILNSGNVGNIVKKWGIDVIGDVYAQTLYVDGATIGAYTGGIIIVATQLNYIYALNANNGNILWSSNYMPKWNNEPGYTVSNVTESRTLTDNSDRPGYGILYDMDFINNENDLYIRNFSFMPSVNVGIRGTPVIDSVRGVLYFVTITKEVLNNITRSSNDWFYHTLNCVSLSNGAHMPNSPKMIGGAKKTSNLGTQSYNYNRFFFNASDFAIGTPGILVNSTILSNNAGMTSNYGNYNNNGSNIIFFHAQLQSQSTGLTLSPDRSSVFITWSDRSHFPADENIENRVGNPHGWVMEFDSISLSNKSLFCTNQTNKGSIFMSGTKIPFDSNNNFYITTDVGTFDSNLTKGNFGSSVLKLRKYNTDVIGLNDFFTPSNYSSRNIEGLNFFTTGAVILPPGINSQNQRIVSVSDNGTLYLMDSENLGKFNTTSNNILNQCNISAGFYGVYVAPSFFNGILYQTIGAIPNTILEGPQIGYQRSCAAINIGSDSSISVLNIMCNVALNPIGSHVLITASNITDTDPLVWIVSMNNYYTSDCRIQIYNKNLTILYRQISIDSLVILPYHVPTIYNGKIIIGGNNRNGPKMFINDNEYSDNVGIVAMYGL